MRFSSRARIVSVLLLSIATSCGIASAQCPSWLAGLGAPGAGSGVKAMVTFDDGSGPAIYAAGSFTSIGQQPVLHVARWNGGAWSQVGAGFDAPVRALTVFDDGGGPALYAGGEFTKSGATFLTFVAKWNGAAWVPVGSQLSAPVHALANLGTRLYAGGAPDLINAGLFPSAFARLDGGAWVAPAGLATFGTIESLAVFDPGTGPRLYLGGAFSLAGSVPVNNIASWNGASFAALASGLNSTVFSLAAFNDGSGSKLYVGGSFSIAGGGNAPGVARWTGAAWQALPALAQNATRVNALRVLNDGVGPGLYAGWTMTTGPVPAAGVSRWTGAAWSAIGGSFDGSVDCIAAFNAGSGGPELFAGGNFAGSGAVAASNVARFTAGAWSALAAGAGIGGIVDACAVFDDGSGPAMYAAGLFSFAGATPALNIARFTGTGWAPLGAGVDDRVLALAVFDDGGGPELYVGGLFQNAGGAPASHVAKWDGVTWAPLSTGTDQPVGALLVFDAGGGPALFAGGAFTTAGGVTTGAIAKWKNNAWSATGATSLSHVIALHAFDDDSGAILVAGGLQTVPSLAGRVARFTGAGWSNIGAFDASVGAFATFDDGAGAGPRLYAGGWFTSSGPTTLNRVARWDGVATWSAVGTGANAEVLSLAIFDDGAGPALFAGGNFTTMNGAATSRLARLRCGAWSAFGGPVGPVNELLASDEIVTGGPALIVGGSFESAGGGVPAHSIAAWRGCAPALESYGAGCPGASGIVPALALAGCPYPAGQLRLTVSNGLGGSTALMFTALAAASIPLPGGCTFLVGGTPAITVLPLDAAGSATLSGTLPPTAVAVTARMQAFVIDPANPLGASATNGVKLAIQ